MKCCYCCCYLQSLVRIGSGTAEIYCFCFVVVDVVDDNDDIVVFVVVLSQKSYSGKSLVKIGSVMD